MSATGTPPVVTRAHGLVLVASSGVLFSTVGLGVRLMEHASAWQIVLYRGLFQAAAVTLLVALRERGAVAPAFARVGRAGIVGALALGVTYNAMILALDFTSVASVVFTLAAAPALTAVLGFVVLRERVRPITIAAMALALSGVAAMTLGTANDARLAGVGLAFVAALGYAVFAVALRHGKDTDMLPTIALSGVAAALMSAPAIDSLAMTPRDLALTAYLGAVALAAGLALFTAGSRALAAAELPLVAMTETVLAPVWVWVWRGEAFDVLTALGGALVLGSIVLQARGGDAAPAHT